MIRPYRLFIPLVIAALLGVSADHLPAQSPRPGCSNTLPTRLIVRERARVSPVGDDAPLNIRQSPGTGSDRIGTIPIGGIFFILNGFECTERYTWYQVSYQGVIGWVAEGDNTTYFTEPYPPAQ